jgi:hypothetical protein
VIDENINPLLNETEINVYGDHLEIINNWIKSDYFKKRSCKHSKAYVYFRRFLNLLTTGDGDSEADMKTALENCERRKHE